MASLNPTLTAEYAEMSGTFDASSATDRAGLFLLGAASAGTVDYRAIARTTGLPRQEAKQLSEKARTTGIFSGRRIAGGDWLDEETGGVAFILDAMVLAGLLKRVPS